MALLESFKKGKEILSFEEMELFFERLSDDNSFPFESERFQNYSKLQQETQGALGLKMEVQIC